VSQPQAPYQHQVRKGITYYNGAQPYQGQASGRQDGTSSKDGKKYFDPQRKRERDYPRQRGYQGKNFDPDFQRKQGNHRPVANYAVDTNLLRVAGGHYEPQGRVDTYYAMHVQVVDQPEDKFWVRKRWRQAVKKLLRWQQAPRVLFNIQLRVKARYYIDDNIERASTAMWRRVLSTLKINRCAGYGCILVPEDLDHDENPAPYKRHKTLYTDQELLEIFNVTTGLDSTSLQPMECDNDLPKLPQLPCMKNRHEDISLSCQVEVLAAYYYEEPGAKYDDVKIEAKRWQELQDQVCAAPTTAAYINKERKRGVHLAIFKERLQKLIDIYGLFAQERWNVHDIAYNLPSSFTFKHLGYGSYDERIAEGFSMDSQSKWTS